MKVVILGVESPIGLSLVRDLGKNGFETICISSSYQSLGVKSKYCKKAILRPKKTEDLVELLLHICTENEKIPLFAVGESDIIKLNTHRNALKDKYAIMFPDQEKMEIVLNKNKTKLIADGLGIETPKTYQIQNLAELRKVNELIKFPVILKWANPHDVSEALNATGQEIEKIEYCLDSNELEVSLEKYAKANVYPLIQEYCRGKGLGQFFLCRDGEVLIQFQHERINEWPPEGGSATLCKSVNFDKHTQCLELSKNLLKKLNWQGVAMVEYRYDATSRRYTLMEINGRFWGSTVLSEVCGINFPSAMIKAMVLKETLQQPKFKKRRCRYMIPEFKRLYRILFKPKSIKDPFIKFSRLEELVFFILNFLNLRCRYYVFSVTDPMPFFSDLNQSLKKLKRNLFG